MELRVALSLLVLVVFQLAAQSTGARRASPTKRDSLTNQLLKGEPSGVAKGGPGRA